MTENRQKRRQLAFRVARKHGVSFPLAFAAVRAGAARCEALAAELAPEPATQVQRQAAFTAAVETLTSGPATLDMSRRPLTHRLHQVVIPATATRSTGV